jgi:hypothetical protein
MRSILVRWGAVIVAGMLTALPFSALPASLNDEPRSAVFILVDLSRTWDNEQSTKENQAVLEAVFEATVELGKRYRPPTHVQVLPIGNASLMRPPLCDAIFDPKLISGSSNSGNVFTQDGRFKKYLQIDCARFVLTRTAEKFTDISGALDTAARLAVPLPEGTRALIILSDMVEDLPHGQTPPKLDLPNFRILILYRVLADDRQTPQRLNERLDDWKNRLSGAGARIEVAPDQGITPGEIERLLGQ